MDRLRDLELRMAVLEHQERESRLRKFLARVGRLERLARVRQVPVHRSTDDAATR
jgi:hypothetical protein